MTCPSVVRVTVNSSPAVARVTAQDAPRVVRVAIPGPAGSSPPVYLVRLDATTANIIYSSRAPVGTPESSPVWPIKRRTFSSAGLLTATANATGAWTNRTSLTYT